MPQEDPSIALGWPQGPGERDGRRVAGLVAAGIGIVAAALLGLLPADLPRHYAMPHLHLDRLGPWPLVSAGFGLLLCLAFGCHGLAWWQARALRATPGRVALIVAVAVAAMVPLLLSYPVLSDDIYYGLLGGRIVAHYGANPYVTPPAAFPNDPWLAFAGWPDLTMPYGPLWVLVSAALSRLAGDGLLANLLAFKALNALAFLAATAAIGHLLRLYAPRYLLAGLVLWAWNPLVLMESVGNGHNGILMVALMLVALWSALRGRGLLAILALALAIALKYVAVAILPVLGLALLRSRATRAARLQLLLGGGLLAGATLAALFAPFWVGLRTIGVLGEAQYYYGSLTAAGRLLFPGGDTSLRDWLPRVLVVAASLLAAPRLARQASEGPAGLATACYGALVLALLGWPFFMPWYVVWVVAFAAVSGRHALAGQCIAFSAAASATYLLQSPLRHALTRPVEFWSTLAALLAFGPLTLAALAPPLRHLLVRLRRPGTRRRSPAKTKPAARRRTLSDTALLPLAIVVGLLPARDRRRRRRPGPTAALALIACLILIVRATGVAGRRPVALGGGAVLANRAIAANPSSQPSPTARVEVAAPTAITAEQPPAPTEPPSPTPRTTATAVTRPGTLAPNELGLIPILMYHTFLADSDSEWNRTPAQFRGDLAYLYAHDYYLTSMHQFVTGDLAIPAGKTPLILTFDDGAESQFRYLIRPDGSTVIDPDSAVGILEEMYGRHPDFGRAGVFYALPLLPFGDDDDKHDQRRFAQAKIDFLLAHGYELGNHTLHHANLGLLSDDQVRQEIAGGDDGLHRYAPNARIETIALPFGVYPDHGDPRLLRSCSYHGHTYSYKAALLVGAEAAPSPFDRRRNLMLTPRIRATDAELGKWFGNYLDAHPAVRYVSDGDPRTVTIPRTLPASLRDRFDPASLGGRTLIRSGP